jgi:hypothetical protein
MKNVGIQHPCEHPRSKQYSELNIQCVDKHQHIVIPDMHMIQYSPPGYFRGEYLGRGAMVARRTLNPFILVRIRAPQPECYVSRKTVVVDEDSISYGEENLTW